MRMEDIVVGKVYIFTGRENSTRAIYKPDQEVRVINKEIHRNVVRVTNGLYEQIVNPKSLRNIGGENMEKLGYMIGNDVVAIKDSEKGLYYKGQNGVVKKFRDDKDGADIGVLFEGKSVVTYVYPDSIEKTIAPDSAEGTNSVCLEDFFALSDLVLVEAVCDGLGYKAGDILIVLEKSSLGMLVKAYDDNIFFIPYKHAKEYDPKITLNFFGLAYLFDNGWYFDEDGYLTNDDYSFTLGGDELNILDSIVFAEHDYDNYYVINGENKVLVPDSMENILFVQE